MTDSTPVFLLAIQRSGTNMTVWSLDKHKDVQLFNEDNPEAFEKFGLRDYDKINGLVSASDKKIVLFKALKDTFRFKKLLNSFPKAKFLFLVRHYEDVVGSNLKAFGDQPIEKLATPIKNYIIQKHGFFNQSIPQEVKDKASNRCKKLFNDDLTKDSIFALYWLNVNSMFFELGMNTNRNLYLGFYEDMVKNPQAEFEKICNHLNIDFDPDLVNDVHSKSVKKHNVNIDPNVRDECDQLWDQLKKRKLSHSK